MKIYNENKTKELVDSELDFEKGYLKADKLFIKHHEAIPEVRAKTAEQVAEELRAHGEEVRLNERDGRWYRTLRIYENGGRDVEEIFPIEYKPAKPAYDEYEDIEVYVLYTAAELQKIADDKRHAELKTELAKVMEDIEQEQLGIVRDDYAEKKQRAAQIINELRILEGKTPRSIITE